MDRTPHVEVFTPTRLPRYQAVPPVYRGSVYAPWVFVSRVGLLSNFAWRGLFFHTRSLGSMR